MSWCHGLDLATSTVYSMKFTDCSDLCHPHAALHSYTSATLHLHTGTQSWLTEITNVSAEDACAIEMAQSMQLSCSREDEQTAATEMKNVCSSGCHSLVLQLQQ